MVTVIDIFTLYKEKRGKALELIDLLAKIKDPNIIAIRKWWYIPDQCIFVETECPINALSPGSFQTSLTSFPNPPPYIDLAL